MFVPVLLLTEFFDETAKCEKVLQKSFKLFVLMLLKEKNQQQMFFFFLHDHFHE